MTENHGVVYVLVNQSMPGLVKIGFTTDTAEARAKDLSSHTGVPTAFTVAWSSERIPEPQSVEKEVHRRLISLRTNRGREFFKIDVKKAIAIVEDLVGEEHYRALEVKRMLKLEREQQKVERNHQWMQERLKVKLIEAHRSYAVTVSAKEDDKSITRLMKAAFVVTPIGFYFVKRWGLHWSIPLLVLGFFSLWSSKKKKRAPAYEIEIVTDALCVRCFQCGQKNLINSRFMVDNPNTKCSCASCGLQLI